MGGKHKKWHATVALHALDNPKYQEDETSNILARTSRHIIIEERDSSRSYRKQLVNNKNVGQEVASQTTITLVRSLVVLGQK